MTGEPATFAATTVDARGHAGAVIAFASGEHVAVAPGELAQVVQLLARTRRRWRASTGAARTARSRRAPATPSPCTPTAAPPGAVAAGAGAAREAVRAWRACVAGAPPAMWAAASCRAGARGGGWQAVGWPAARAAGGADGGVGRRPAARDCWRARAAREGVDGGRRDAGAAAAEGTHGRDGTFCLRHPAPLRRPVEATAARRGG